MFKKEESPRVKKIIINAVSIISLMAAFYSKIPDIFILPNIDESYHITENIAHGELSSLNPYYSKYKYLGHLPGYPASLFIWFKFFPHNYVSAHTHAFIFSFLFIVSFYFFVSLYLPWPSSLMVSLFICKNNYFNEICTQSLGDIPMLLFFFVALIFLNKKYYKALAITLCFLILFRESGLALIVSIFILSITLNEKDKKQLILSTLPSLSLLAIFFALNYLTYGTFHRHPFATGTLHHHNGTFFSWNTHKQEMLIKSIGWIKNSFPGITSLFILPCIFASVLKKTKPYLEKNLIILVLILANVFFLIFFAFYHDIIPRDYLPIIVITSFLLIYSINKISSQIGFCFSLILFLLPTNINMTKSYRNIYSRYSKETAEYLLQNYQNKKVCLNEPLFYLTAPIHGYFPKGHHLIFDCNQPDVLLEREESYNLDKIKNIFDHIKSSANYKKVKSIGVNDYKAGLVFSYEIFEKVN